MMILKICIIVHDLRKRHFDFGFKGQGLEFELYIVSLLLLLLFFFGGGLKMSNVKAKFVICISQCFYTIIILPFDI